MALPLTTINAQEAFVKLKAGAAALKSFCLQVQNGPTVDIGVLEQMLAQAQALESFATSVAVDTTLTANFVVYVQQISASTTVQADFTNSRTALQALVAAIIKDIPVDAYGHLLDRVMDSSGNITPVQVTPSQLPNTLPAITGWLATVT